MAITFKAKRIRGDQFTSEDLIETQFLYSEVGKMYECITTIEQVSGVTVTHGGGGGAGEYLHYKIVEEDSDSDGYIDYQTQKVQVQQEEKGDSVIKVVAKYITKNDFDTWETEHKAWSDAYVTITFLADGSQDTNVAPEAPDAPVLTHSIIKSGDIPLKWADDTFV